MRLASIAGAALLSAAALAGSSVAGQAATFNGVFSLSGSSFREPGLVMATSTTSGAVGFQLDTVGQSVSFDLFDIWAAERRVNGNNTRTSSLLADFTFSGIGASGSATGSTTGHGGATQHASIAWGAPVVLTFGNGGILSLVLDNASFSHGTGGLSQGQANGATIRATATLVAAPVPLPASGLALLGALGGAAAVLRRRRRAG
ncbi:hypothetical protein [Albidovulum sp.]|jgi:hypothetical protein|uniref:hypothetical protein n=1 Tax=Albidovulum sp. TaxID=1872424 RepID=UPI00304D5EE0